MSYADADRVIRNNKVAQRMFEGRMLVITPLDSKLHRFNAVGTFLWQQLERPKSVGQLNAAVSEAFESDGTVDISGDIQSFLSEMVAKGLVSISERESRSA